MVPRDHHLQLDVKGSCKTEYGWLANDTQGFELYHLWKDPKYPFWVSRDNVCSPCVLARCRRSGTWTISKRGTADDPARSRPASTTSRADGGHSTMAKPPRRVPDHHRRLLSGQDQTSRSSTTNSLSIFSKSSVRLKTLSLPNRPVSLTPQSSLLTKSASLLEFPT